MERRERIRLYLDDVRTPKDPNNEWVAGIPQWEVVRNYDEFVAHIQLNGLDAYEVISLDHDLGEQATDEFYNNALPNYKLNYDNIVNEKTGYDCAKWLVDYCIKKGVKHPPYQVHSMNPVGKSNIISYVESYNRTV